MRNRQRGFSLIVVFLLIVVMVGVAAALLVTTQGDLQVAGQDREAANAFYGAEAGIAFAKDWLAQQPILGSWNSVLQSGAVQLCTPTGGAKPGTLPQAGQAAVVYDAQRGTTYRWCVHNNAGDPNYVGNPPTGDTTDSDGAIAIESYGYSAEGTASHLYVEVRVNIGAQSGGDYFMAGNGETHQAQGEKGTYDTTQKVTF